MIHIGLITVGLAHSAIIMAAVGIMDGAETTTIGTVLITDGIRIVLLDMVMVWDMAVVTGTITGIRVLSLCSTTMRLTDAVLLMVNGLLAVRPLFQIAAMSDHALM